MAQIPQNRQFQEAKVPSHWGTSERRYAQSVNDLFERLFYMFGRLSKDDLSKPLNKEITDATGNILRIETDVDNVTLTLSTVQGDVSSLTLTTQEFATRLTNAEGDLSALEQTAQQFGVRLQNAEDDVTTLEATAQGLQTSVTNLGNTKNRTYINAIAPSVGLIAGDLWIDSANGNLLKRWSGSAWAAVQDGAISIAQQQADKIQWLVASGTSAANMTLTSQLYSLIADNIDLSANNSIKLAVSGGTNLLTGTEYETTTFTAWTKNTASTTQGLSTNTAKFGTHSLLLTRPANNASGGVYRQVALEANQPYTFSVWAYRDQGVFTMWCSAASSTRVSISSAYVWQRYSYTFTPSTSGIFYLYIIAQDSAEFASVYIERPQLEKGTMATDWSPAPKDPASGVKTSKVTIDGTGIAMTTGGTFTTTSQNFNIDAAGNVVMKGTVEASAGKIAGFSMSGGMLIDTATNGMNLELDPANGVLDVGMMRITKYGTSDGFDIFYQGNQSGACRVYSGSKSLNLTSKVGGTEQTISIGDGIYLFGNTYFKDSAFGYHAGSYVPMLNSKNWLNYIYPVGAIYMSSASTSPGTLFGGTWTAITNPPTGAGYWWKRTG